MLDIIYNGLDVILPFAWINHVFMKNAFLAVLMITPLLGILSTMVVSNRMAFFSDSLGHGAFTGVAVGVLLGSGEPLVSLIIFSIIFAALSHILNIAVVLQQIQLLVSFLRQV